MQSSVLGLVLKPSWVPWSVALICPPSDYTAPKRRSEYSLKTQRDCRDNHDDDDNNDKNSGMNMYQNQ